MDKEDKEEKMIFAVYFSFVWAVDIFVFIHHSMKIAIENKAPYFINLLGNNLSMYNIICMFLTFAIYFAFLKTRKGVV